MHGHTYTLTITCRGPIGDDGMIFDNARIDEVLQIVVGQLDHRHLNEAGLPFSDNPTAERMLAWIWVLAAHVPALQPWLWRIELQEGDRSTFALEREPWEEQAFTVARGLAEELGIVLPTESSDG